MVLTYARDITKDFGGQAVRDCVLTVPMFATQHERRALIMAAEVAGLKVLSLIEDNTAAALQYGKDNVFENKTVLYYNMGASATQVTVAQYSNYTVKELGKNKTVGSFEVLGKAWDATLGGEQLDLELMNFFIDDFKAKHGVDVSESAKPIAKLRAQATKTKHVLSANQDIPIKVNGVAEDKDYSVHVYRKDLDKLAADFLSRATAPVTRALASAGITLADVDAVEMLGGAQRVPAVQRELATYFGDALPLGVHLNADEAPALGAAFAAANISTAFKVRKTGMTDYSPFPVGVSLKTIAPVEEDAGVLGSLFGSTKKTDAEEALEAEALKWSKSTTVFKPRSRLDSKKVIAFHHDHDIACDLFYAEAEGGAELLGGLPSGTPLGLGGFNVSGVRRFAQGMAAKNLTGCGPDLNPKPKVTLHFKLDASGIVRLASASATCEQPAQVEEENENKTEAADTATEENAEEKAAEAEKAEEKSGEEKTGEEKSEEKTEAKEGDEAAEKEGDDEKDEDKAEEKTEEEIAAEKAAAKKAKKEKKEAEKKAKAEAKKKAKKASEVYKAELLVSEDFSAAVMASVSPSAADESKDKLAYLQAKDDERMAKLAAKNTLEAYLYGVKNKVEDEAAAVELVSTEEQRTALSELVASSLEWLDDDGYDAVTDVYVSKKADVEDLAEPLFFRLAESTSRPEAVTQAVKRLSDIRLLMAKWVDTLPQVTEEERGDVIALVEKAEAWVDDKVAAQKEVAGHEAPKFTAAEVQAQLKATANLVTRLSRKPKPKPKPVVLNTTNATETTNATDANATETANATDTAGASEEGATEGEAASEGEGESKKEGDDESKEDDNDEL